MRRPAIFKHLALVGLALLSVAFTTDAVPPSNVANRRIDVRDAATRELFPKALPPQTEYVLVKRAGHFSFVASFPGVPKLVAGEAAQDPEGFDRDAMHEVMNSEIVGFFDRKLPPGQARRTQLPR